jgi:hypothetical protein
MKPEEIKRAIESALIKSNYSFTNVTDLPDDPYGQKTHAASRS